MVSDDRRPSMVKNDIRDKVREEVRDRVWARVYANDRYQAKIETWNKLKPIIRDQVFTQSWFQMADLIW